MMGMGVNGLLYMFCRNLAGTRFFKAGNSAYLRIRSSVHGRGAVEPRARGDDNQGGRNDFLRFQEQLLRRKKQKLFFGVSVGNGVRGGITLSSKSKKIFYAHKLFYCLESIFMPTNCTNGHESLSMGKMATCTVARICTNAMRDGCLGHVLWRSATSSRFSAALGIARTSS